jgi:hypothetical protein
VQAKYLGSAARVQEEKRQTDAPIPAAPDSQLPPGAKPLTVMAWTWGVSHAEVECQKTYRDELQCYEACHDEAANIAARSTAGAGAIRLCMVGMIGHDNRCAGDQPEHNNNPESDIHHGRIPSGAIMKEAAN